MDTPLLQVLVVDDYEPWRRDLCLSLERYSRLQVIAEASDGPGALVQAHYFQPDLVFLDIGLPQNERH
jgi:CheY-like chemotaxis protein